MDSNRACVVCGTPYAAKTHNSRYCSDCCRKAARKAHRAAESGKKNGRGVSPPALPPCSRRHSGNLHTEKKSTDAKKAYTSVLAAAKDGGRLDALEKLRDKLASEIDACDSGRDLAALSRQLTDVLKQIEEAGKSKQQKGATVLELITSKHATGLPAPTRRTTAKKAN